jgi:hypothetical protein
MELKIGTLRQLLTSLRFKNFYLKYFSIQNYFLLSAVHLFNDVLFSWSRDYI